MITICYFYFNRQTEREIKERKRNKKRKREYLQENNSFRANLFVRSCNVHIWQNLREMRFLTFSRPRSNLLKCVMYFYIVAVYTPCERYILMYYIAWPDEISQFIAQRTQLGEFRTPNSSLYIPVRSWGARKTRVIT